MKRVTLSICLLMCVATFSWGQPGDFWHPTSVQGDRVRALFEGAQTSPPPTVYYILAATDNAVYRSTDGGANWSNVTGAMVGRLVNGFTTGTITQGTVFAATDNGAFKSVDAGLTWAAFNAGILPADMTLNCISLGNNVYPIIGTNNGSYWLPPAYTTWSKMTGYVGKIYDITFTGTGYDFAATDDGIWRCPGNNPTAWTEKNHAVTDGRTFVAIGADPTGSAPVVKLVADASGAVYRSTNLDNSSSAFTWTLDGTGLPAATVVNDILCPAIGSYYFAATGAGVYVSNNEGLNWADNSSGGLAGKNVARLAASTTANLLAGAATLAGAVPDDGVYAASHSVNAVILDSPANGATWLDLTLVLSWYPYPANFMYHLEYSTQPNFSPMTTVNTTLTSASIGPLLENTTYYWRVRGEVGGTYLSYSEVRNFTTRRTSPPTAATVDDDFLSQAEVDAYNAAHGTNLHYGYDAFATIQEGVNAVVGSTVTVLPGTYVEQVHITTANLQLVGAGVDQTIIKSPAALTAFFNSGTADNYPVVFVDGVSGVAISQLTVDGDHQGNTNYRFQGIGFWNAGGSVRHAKVINVSDNPLSGAQHGVGIYAFNNTGGPYSLGLDDVLVQDFQKTAVSLSGTGLTVDLDNVTTIGAGPTGVTAQNGIQISYGASGTVDNCDISAIAYTGATWTASGLLGYQAGTILASAVDLDACQTSVYWQDSNGTFDDGAVTNPAGDALYAYSSGAKANDSARLAAGPLTETSAGGGSRSAVAVTVSNSTFAGNNLPDSWGLAAWGNGPLTFTVTGCTVENWDYGVVAYDDGGATFDMEVHQSDLAPNGTAALFSNAGQTVDATCNWWGDSKGPDTVPFPNPAGETITGDAVYEPWLIAPGGACAGFHDNVSVIGPGGCLTPTNTCREVTVAFNRFDTTPLRAISVSVQLSPELALCTGAPGTDITVFTGPGTWMAGFNATYLVVSNGNGLYTVDIAILGFPCGPTAGGNLFKIALAKAAGVTSDATGLVTVTDVTVRDCTNAPLPGLPGDPVSVNIDLTLPDAVAGLTASQVKTGNDNDGTTKILVGWSAYSSPDADHIQIWRKGFGAYPEYDDAGGAAPVLPLSVANGWTQVADVTPATASFVDEPPTRDFWYYGVLVHDACGNVSAPSNLTGGTLNYHLGDVSDGTTPGHGDNLVSTIDVSHLGGHYGIHLVPGDPYNYLDVGPTTDFGVDALPTTDNEVEFEDLIMFAMNYGVVERDGEPQMDPVPGNTVVLQVAESPQSGTMTAEILFAGDGQIQGLSIPLIWNENAVEPVGFTAGELIPQQGVPGLVLNPEPGTIDAAIFGLRDRGICGRGTLARVTFHIVGSEDPGIRLGTVIARNGQNHPVMVNEGSTAVIETAPLRTGFYMIAPNPFRARTELTFGVVRSDRVRCGVYSVQGRLVARLVDGILSAGRHTIAWDGRDDAGHPVGSGTYFARLETPDATQTVQITLLK